MIVFTSLFDFACIVCLLWVLFDFAGLICFVYCVTMMGCFVFYLFAFRLLRFVCFDVEVCFRGRLILWVFGAYLLLALVLVLVYFLAWFA